MRRRWREPAAIAAEIDRIRSLRLDALRRHWRLVFGRVPPAGLSKDLLGGMIAARLQERAFGGLDRDAAPGLAYVPQQLWMGRRCGVSMILMPNPAPMKNVVMCSTA
jgi:hypothetical protein